MTERVIVYIDGFNLYHAIKNLGPLHLKWVDLCSLAKNFIDPVSHRIVALKYFSAYATWLQDPCIRHRAYVAALEAVGVTPIMGQSKSANAFASSVGRMFPTTRRKRPM